MGYLNQNKNGDNSHLNWMGGKSYDVNSPITRLRIAAASCFFGEPMYYHRDSGDKRPRKVQGNDRHYLRNSDVKHLRDTLNAIDMKEWRSLTPANMMESAIDNALDHDVQATLGEAVRLRQQDNIRTTPQVILVRAANHPKARGTGFVRRFAKNIVVRADEPAVGLAYQLATYGKDAPIPNSLKKAWKDALEKFKDYHLGKYQMSKRDVKLVDVVNLVHPKSDSVDKLVNGTLSNDGKTWEAIVSAEGSNKESWTKSLDVMGHMAILRNLRNFLKFDVNPDDFIGKLVKGAEKGKQLPFRYYSAYRAIENDAPGKVLDGVEESLIASIGALPSLPGKTMSLCDNSGSAQGYTTSSLGTMRVSTIANLTGVITGMMSDDGHLGVFGDRLETMAIRKKSSVFDQLKKAEGFAYGVGGGTENGIWIFFRDAIKKKEHWDNVFVFSDMQAGHGRLYGTNPGDYSKYRWNGGRMIDVAKLIKEYRAKVNKNVKVFLVQVAGYQDTLVPEFYKDTYILGGWGEGLLKFAGAMANMDQ